MEKHPNNHHHSERLEKLEAKAHEEKSVAGHPMPAADIFKFVGLIAFFVIMIVVVVLVWPMIHELFEPGGVDRVTSDIRNAGPWGFLILLAGIPSVVYGFFGLVVIVPLIQKTLDLPVGETAFAGSVVLAIMALPTIITVAEDAMRTTPRAMKEASLALGATQWQTIYKVIIPYSISGITSAVVLGIGRAIGETMAVLMVTGNAAVIPTSFFEPVRTIPATIAAELGEAPAGGAHYQALFMLGAVLFLITLGLSIAVEYISSKRKI